MRGWVCQVARKLPAGGLEQAALAGLRQARKSARGSMSVAHGSMSVARGGTTAVSRGGSHAAACRSHAAACRQRMHAAHARTACGTAGWSGPSSCLHSVHSPSACSTEHWFTRPSTSASHAMLSCAHVTSHDRPSSASTSHPGAPVSTRAAHCARKCGSSTAGSSSPGRTSRGTGLGTAQPRADGRHGRHGTARVQPFGGELDARQRLRGKAV